MRSITALAAAAAMFAGKVAADNQAIIHNYCQFPVYLWSVDASDCTDGTPRHDPREPEIVQPGAMWSESMRELVTGGVSIKLAPKNDLYMPITQLEYTKNYDTWYDVSNVNCVGTECPFQAHGLYLESGPSCPTVSCKPGLLTCHGAYTLWDDNWASLCCPDGDPDITLYLCSDGPQPSNGGYEVEEQAVRPPPPPPVTSIAKQPKPPKPTTTYEPATQVVEVTEISTVVVTVTPSPRPYHQARSRHIHNHAQAHARRF